MAYLTPGRLMAARELEVPLSSRMLLLRNYLCVSRIVGWNYNHTLRTLVPKQIFLAMALRKEKLFSHLLSSPFSVIRRKLLYLILRYFSFKYPEIKVERNEHILSCGVLN